MWTLADKKFELFQKYLKVTNEGTIERNVEQNDERTNERTNKTELDTILYEVTILMRMNGFKLIRRKKKS